MNENKEFNEVNENGEVVKDTVDTTEMEKKSLLQKAKKHRKALFAVGATVVTGAVLAWLYKEGKAPEAIKVNPASEEGKEILKTMQDSIENAEVEEIVKF